MEFTAKIRKSKNGMYIAQCEQIPSALSQGKTFDEAKENLKDAISMIINDDNEDKIDKNKKLIIKGGLLCN